MARLKSSGSNPWRPQLLDVNRTLTDVTMLSGKAHQLIEESPRAIIGRVDASIFVGSVRNCTPRICQI